MGTAVIGLTGGIGCGKSTVAAMLVDAGAVLVDTDAIARQLTAAGGDGIAALTLAFGRDVLDADGALDRARMRNLVFNDSAAKQRLEAVLHPLIADEANRQATRAIERPVVFDVPLLAESPRWRRRVDRIVVVDCPVEQQLARVMRRSGWDAEAVRRVIASQADPAVRRAIADAVIFNGPDVSLTALNEHVSTLWSAWFGTAATLWNNRR